MAQAVRPASFWRSIEPFQGPFPEAVSWLANIGSVWSDFPVKQGKNREFCKFEAQNRRFRASLAQVAWINYRFFSVAYAPQTGVSLLFAGTGYVIACNRGLNRRYQAICSSEQEAAGSPNPSTLRCFDQASGIAVFFSASRLRSSGWRPSRIARWMSGARKASRSKLRS